MLAATKLMTIRILGQYLQDWNEWLLKTNVNAMKKQINYC